MPDSVALAPAPATIRARPLPPHIVIADEQPRDEDGEGHYDDWVRDTRDGLTTLSDPRDKHSWIFASRADAIEWSRRGREKFRMRVAMLNGLIKHDKQSVRGNPGSALARWALAQALRNYRDLKIARVQLAGCERDLAALGGAP